MNKEYLPSEYPTLREVSPTAMTIVGLSGSRDIITAVAALQEATSAKPNKHLE